PAYVALGLGVAGIGVGTVFGLLPASKKGDLDNVCSADKVCPPSKQHTIDSANTIPTVSTVGFVVGAVGVLVGGYLYFAARPTKAASTAHSRVTFLPTSRGFAASF